MFEVFQWSVRVKLGQERISITLPQCQYQRLLSLLPLIICTIIIIIIIIKIFGSLTSFWFLNGKRRTLGFKPGAIFTSLECGRDGSRSTHFPSEPFPPPFRYCTSMNTVTPISRLAVSINFFAKAGNRLVAL